MICVDKYGFFYDCSSTEREETVDEQFIFCQQFCAEEFDEGDDMCMDECMDTDGWVEGPFERDV